MYGPREALTLLDIGACEGEDSVRYARRFPRARLFSFEPLPDNQRLVLENFRRHGVGTAELVPIALSNRPGQDTFHVSSGSPPVKFAGERWNYGNKSSSLLQPATPEPMHGWIEFKRTIVVPTDTLARFAAQRGISRIDFIHMDVQGAELMVLEGAGAALTSVAALWLEITRQPLYQDQPLKGEVQRFMEQHGFLLLREIMNGIEGDQLYVNRRFRSLWRYRAARWLLSLLRSARFRTGALKARLWPSPHHP